MKQNCYFNDSKSTRCIIAFKILDGFILFCQLIWTIYWSIETGQDVVIYIVAPNIFIAAWSVLYLFFPTLSFNAWFVLVSKIVSFINITLTLLMVYAIFSETNFAFYALVYVLYVGWIGVLSSATLLICLYADNRSSPSLYQIIMWDYEQAPQRTMVYYVLNTNMRRSEMVTQPIPEMRIDFII